jgi:Winged helix DNA-binding domain
MPGKVPRVVLTQRQLNRAVLARQGLLERRELGLPAMLEQMGTLQAQYAPSMYIGLWARLAGFERAALTRALHAFEVLQGTLMRFTIHLVSRDDYWPLAHAVAQPRRAAWLRLSKGHDLAEEAALLRAALSNGPLKRKEIEALIGRDALRGIHAYVDLIRHPPSGTWERRRADVFALAPEPRPPVPGHIVRRYLTGFGPAARADIANWAGMGLREIEPELQALELVEHEAQDGTTLYDLPGGPLPDPDAPAPVRFLPTWDATLLAHARRTLVLPEQYRERIFHVRMPQSIGTFLVDGQVAGTWTPSGELTYFHEVDRRPVEQEAARLAAFIA